MVTPTSAGIDDVCIEAMGCMVTPNSASIDDVCIEAMGCMCTFLMFSSPV